jgi:hypothetical protein
MKVVRMRPGDFAPRETAPIETAQARASSPGTRGSLGGEPRRQPHLASAARGAEAERHPPTSPSIRSTEGRRWSADLVSPDTAGLVLHGMGGIGKSTLAAEIVARAGRVQPERLTITLSGEVGPDEILAGLAAALSRHPAAAAWDGARAAAVSAADRIDLPWEHRLALLRRHVLSEVPVLVSLDDFDDNMSGAAGTWTVRDPALAGLLAGWTGGPHPGRLLITCRHPFTLPGAAGQALGWRHLGPLSRAGAVKLAMSLPALGQLDDDELDRAWRLLGGHPRAMEYLDALLGPGQARFAELSRRLRTAIQATTGRPVGRTGPDAPTGLPAAAAARIAEAAADLLLGELYRRLSPAAQALLTGTSVYREPVGCHALLLPGRPAGQHGQRDGGTGPATLAGPVADCEAAGLLTADRSSDPPVVFVHRWTASELHRRLAEAGRGGEVTGAHQRAAEYWQGRVSAQPQDRGALIEAGYHRLRAGGLAGQDRPAAGRAVSIPPPHLLGRPRRRLFGAGRRQLRLLGLAAAAVAAAVLLTAGATGAFWPARTGPASPPDPGHPPARVTVLASRSAAVRGQAAAWVAQQVSRDAIVACDPAMCAALQARGIAPGNLLVLRPSAADPLGSDVVMATAAVRSQFGSRLASVYAPEVIASFGTGELRIDVRAVAPDGAAAYRATLAADVAARRAAGRQLLRNSRISVTAAARSDLVTGRVDARLLITLAAVAADAPVRITGFTDAGPGAGPDVPLRAVQLATALPAAGGAAALRNMLTFVRAQRPPFRPARASVVRGAAGSPALSIEFAAPSPAGLLHPRPPS